MSSIFRSYTYNAVDDDLDGGATPWFERDREVLARSLDEAYSIVVEHLRGLAAEAGCYRPGETVDYIIRHGHGGSVATSGTIMLEGEGLWRRED